MKPPCIAVIDDESDSLELAVMGLRAHAIGADVPAFKTSKEFFIFLDNGGNPTAVLCDYKLGEGDTGIDVARKFSERGYQAPFFLITGLENVRNYAFEAMREGYVDQRLILKTEVKERNHFVKTLDELIKKERIVQPQNLGIIGLGKLGMGGIVSDVLKLQVGGIQCLEHLYLYSNFLLDRKNKKYRECLPDLLGPSNSMHVTLVNSPEEVFDKVQIAVIATGAHGLRPSQFTRREDIEKVILETSIHKMEKIYGAMLKTNYAGLNVVFTSPPEPHLYMGANLTEHEATFVCPTADESRQTAVFYQLEREKIEKELKMHLDTDALKVASIGWHGRERVDVAKTRIRRGGEWITLGKLMPLYLNAEYAKNLDDRICAITNKQGYRSEVASEIWNLPPSDTPSAFIHFFRAIATCQSRTPGSVLCYSAGEETGLGSDFRGYFLRPARFDRQRSQVLPDIEGYTVADAPQYLKNILKDVLTEQRNKGIQEYLMNPLRSGSRAK